MSRQYWVSLAVVLIGVLVAPDQSVCGQQAGEPKVPAAVEALFEAAFKGSVDGVTRALKAGADVNFAGPMGLTPLMLAVERHHPDVMRVLLKAGAKVNAAATDGITALMVSAFGGHADLIQPLVDAGANVNARDKEGRTALMHAASGGVHAQAEDAYAAAVKVLLAARADVQLQAGDGRTAMAMASDEDFRQVVALLKGAGAVEVPSPAQPFLDAVIRGSTEDVRAMLKDPALAKATQATRDPLTNVRKMTVLQLAATRGHIEIVKALLQAGADVNARSSEGTALVNAAQWTPADKKEEIVTILLEAGADVSATDSSTSMAIHHAATAGSAGVVRALLKAGVDVNAVMPAFGETPLIAAASRGHSAVVIDLIKAGASVNTPDLNKRTAVMMAAAKGDVTSVRALIAAGADVNVVENNGGTALAWAKNLGHQEIVELLVRAGAKK